MRAFKASFAYFALVFVTGFVLGAIRIPFVVPRLGVRWAELLEMPLMLCACFLAARFCVRRYGPFPALQRLGIGLVALGLLVAAELVLTVASGRSVAGYVAGRDPVSGTAYLIALIVFAALPLLVARRHGAGDSFARRPPRGAAGPDA